MEEEINTLIGSPFTSRLGDFIVTYEVGDGLSRVVYCVPPERRPPHWHDERPLPATGKSVGRIDSPTFRSKVEQSIVQYDSQLELFWKREELISATGDRSVRALAELYRVEDRLGRKYSLLRDSSKERVNRMIEVIAQWADANGSPSFAEIGRDELVDMLQLFDDRPALKCQVKNALSLLMQTAVWVKWREDNPILTIKVPNPPAPVREIWTQDDVDAYVAASAEFGHPAVGGIIQFMYETGQRPGDARRLRHGVDYSNGYIRIRQSKGGAIVNGKLTLATSKAMDAMRIADSDYVFPNPKTGTCYTQEELTYVFDKIRSEVGDRDDRWLVMYTLRHTFVVRQVAAETHPYDIAALTGHTHASVNRIMEKYFIRDAKAAMRALKNLNRAEGGSDADFGDFHAGGGDFGSQAAKKKKTILGSGLARRRAIQFAKRYLEREEVEQMIIDNVELRPLAIN